MISTKGYAAFEAKDALKPFEFQRRAVGPNDVLIDILFCGVCHSDIHQVDNDWKVGRYPMVPGHEIVGIVKKVGADVKKFAAGDHVGVGCFVGSCRHCDECKADQEQFCDGRIKTYNSRDPQPIHPEQTSMTYGGYSNNIVVDEHFVLSIPDNLDLAAAAPLLCAGITTFSPLKHWKITAEKSVGVVGLGGLGHVAVKIAKAMGARVTVLTHSANKVDDAKRLGADEVILTHNPEALKSHQKQFDFILDTVSVPHNINPYIQLLKRDGSMVFVGLPGESAPSVSIGNLIFLRRSISGSLIGGLKETQEMLDFCGQHNITADIETINMQDINQAFKRVLQSDVKYRFVIDMKSLQI